MSVVENTFTQACAVCSPLRDFEGGILSVKGIFRQLSERLARTACQSERIEQIETFEWLRQYEAQIEPEALVCITKLRGVCGTGHEHELAV
jgi:hypothetical protein